MSGISGIAKNLRNFAKKSGKYQENWWIFRIVRKMSGIFYDVLSRDIPISYVFTVQCEKRVEC